MRESYGSTEDVEVLKQETGFILLPVEGWHKELVAFCIKKKKNLPRPSIGICRLAIAFMGVS